MDRNLSQKWLIWSIVVLVVLNLASLSGLWYVRLSYRQPPPPVRAGGVPFEDMIVKEVGLDKDQEARFRKLHARHRQVKDSLESEVYCLKSQVQEELFSPSPDTAKLTALAARIGVVHAEFEKQVDRHSLDLKALCRPDQYPKLEAVLNELLKATRHGPPQEPTGRGDERRPPPRRPRGDGAPPPGPSGTAHP